MLNNSMGRGSKEYICCHLANIMIRSVAITKATCHLHWVDVRMAKAAIAVSITLPTLKDWSDFLFCLGSQKLPSRRPRVLLLINF